MQSLSLPAGAQLEGRACVVAAPGQQGSRGGKMGDKINIFK